MICPRCHTKNPADATYCQGCGLKLYQTTQIVGKVCPKCGHINALDEEFCTNCHADLRAVAHSTITSQKPINYQLNHRNTWIKIGALIALICAVILTVASVRNHGWMSQTTRIFVVKRSLISKHLTKKFYIISTYQNHYFKKSHNLLYYHAVTYPSFSKAEQLSYHKVNQLYAKYPKRRITIVAPLHRHGSPEFTAIQYTADSNKYFKLTPYQKKSTQRMHYVAHVKIHGHHYLDKIYIQESE